MDWLLELLSDNTKTVRKVIPGNKDIMEFWPMQIEWRGNILLINNSMSVIEFLTDATFVVDRNKRCCLEQGHGGND